MKQSIASINMIKQQLRTNRVVNEKILDLYTKIDRENFITEPYKSFAYSDLQIPLAHEQRMMTPLEEALLLQSLELTGEEIVLEIGTGSGFLTALLSQLCKKVVSAEQIADLAEFAQQNLAQYNFNNIELVCGDGSQVLTDYAPYDIIIFTCATLKIDSKISSQLAPQGKMFTMIGQSPMVKACVQNLDKNGHWHSKLIFETDLPTIITNKTTDSFVF